jgi:glyoxylase-like metal-dependent hydrolase (beta-lactamase superfamily II)
MPLRLPQLLRPGGPSIRMPMLAFALRHPREGTILVDTGVHPDTARDLRGDFGPVLGLVFRSMRPGEESFDQQLAGLGIDPAEVRLVVMTHLHADHTSGMRLLPEAEVVCSHREWKAAHGRSPALGGYVPSHLPDDSRMRLIDFEREGEPHGPFSRTVDLLGDGSIRLLSTPGHTPGHLSVLVRLPGERQALLVGDAAYTLRNIREEVLSFFTVDDKLYLRSLREIRAFAEREPEVPLVPSHDPDAWRELATG